MNLPDLGLILPKFATSVEGPPPPPRPAPPAATGPDPAPFSGASYSVSSHDVKEASRTESLVSGSPIA